MGEDWGQSVAPSYGHVQVHRSTKDGSGGSQVKRIKTKLDHQLEKTMRRVANGIFVLVVPALLMTTAACGQSGPAPSAGQTPSAGPGGAADVDRTVLPIAEPTHPAITELDARKVEGATHLRGQGADGRAQCAGHPAR